ncbi:MAG: hypothetical protein POELPBGB_02953 [Bacteroidia bacterium]|nr:hypothetical protein [Bacteroidia bacterium]
MINLLAGNNFSGRSFYLKCYLDYPEFTVQEANNNKANVFRDNRKDLYLGPIPDNFITGICDNVKDELFRYNKTLEQSIGKEIEETFGFERLFKQSPFDLSGGEKSILTVLSFALRNPRSLGIDCTLEQLSLDWKHKVINILSNLHIPEIFLIDNRYKEIGPNLINEVRFTPIIENKPFNFKIDNINSSLYFPQPGKTIKRISIENLSFSYTNKKVLENLNMELLPGNIYQFEGANGTGKTTLSKILTGLLKPAKSTRISINDIQVDLYAKPGQICGYCYQQPDDQIFNSVSEGELYDPFSTITNNNINKIAVAEAFGIKDILNVNPLDLPLTIRKRLSIASILLYDRPIYIFDEPTLYLDDENAKELALIMKKAADMGKIIILISHSKTFVELFETINIINVNSINYGKYYDHA